MSAGSPESAASRELADSPELVASWELDGRPELDGSAELVGSSEPAGSAEPAGQTEPAGSAEPAGPEVLRILFLEDTPSDADLTQRRLVRAGLAFTGVVVDSRASFVEQLASFGPDVIVADYNVPGFSGETALEVVQEQCPRVPFVFLSSALGDEAAVDLIRRGAKDFVLKDRPGRLPVAIRNAVQDAEQAALLAQLETQLRQTQRMASLGRLAGGIAHGFNNHVGAMINYAGFIREEAAVRARDGASEGEGAGDDGWAAVARDAEQIAAAGARVIRVVGQLLAIGGQQTVRRELVDLNDVVTGMEQLLRSTIGGSVRFRFQPEERLPAVSADPDQLRQVLLNLALNAREAMPDGGSFEVATDAATINGAADGGHPALAPGEYVRLSVADTGVGMDPETVEHAFEPFYTTKPFVEGGGLGLASSYGIISQVGGAIGISSALGAGTTVTVWLPACAAHEDAR
jgi:two-component system, cell cycle sensor histidine kinase and response regulator CckA